MYIGQTIRRFSKIIRGLRDTRQRTENPCVGGSIPPSATKNNHLHHHSPLPRPICGPVSNIQCSSPDFVSIALRIRAVDVSGGIEHLNCTAEPAQCLRPAAGGAA